MEEKKKNKKIIIITLLVLIIIALIGVGGYFGYQYWESNQTVGTQWGDTYLENLQNRVTNGEFSDTENGTLVFIQLEENQVPAMVLNYENDANQIMEISVFNEANELKTKKYQVEKNTELNLDMLYDIKTKEYNWYEHETKEDGTEIFTQVNPSDIKNETEPAEDQRHEFKKEEMTEQEVKEGEIPSIPKFEEEFVKPEIEKKETEVELKGEIDKKELKNKLTEAVEDYTSQDQTITEEVKEKVENSLKDLENKKEEIKKAEEAKKKAEEEAAAKKAAEEAAKGLKVGSFTLKYGT